MYISIPTPLSKYFAANKNADMIFIIIRSCVREGLLELQGVSIGRYGLLHGDQIGRIFACRVFVNVGHFFENLQKKAPFLGYVFS
jgi:hypothetical protein